MSGGRRILIVEDDEDISMVEEAYLQTAGFQTVIVTDGAEVSCLLEEELFDLILLDVMLPGKSGYEVCREIRDKVDIPILMVTARTESVDKIRGLGLGADDYIAKPFDPAELVARVNANKEDAKGVEAMCRIVEDIIDSEKKEIALELLKLNKLSLEEIAKCSRLSLEEVEKIAKDEGILVG